MFKKLNLLSIISIEYILIIIAVFNFTSIQILRNKALKSFQDFDESFSVIQKQFLNFDDGLSISDSEISTFEKNCEIYSYFDEEVQNNQIIISTILRDNIIQSSASGPVKNLFFISASNLLKEVHEKQRDMLSGYDIVLNFTIFLVMLSFLAFIIKNFPYRKPIIIPQKEEIYVQEVSLPYILMVSLVVIFAISVNFAGTLLSRKISYYPLYLDSLLTIGVTAAFGLVPGLCCAVLSNTNIYLFNLGRFPFTICHILTAVTAWLTFKRRIGKNVQPKRRLSIEAFLWAGLWSGLTNGLVGNLISSFIFPASTSIKSIDNITYAIFAATRNLNLAISISGFLTNLTDKMISALLSILFYKLICFCRKKQCS